MDGAARRSFHGAAGLKGCASPLLLVGSADASLDGSCGPLTPAALVFGSCAPPPMASIARKQSLSRFSCELLDELSYCCQLAANPRLRLAELADELLFERQSQLPEQVQDPEILALLPY